MYLNVVNHHWVDVSADAIVYLLPNQGVPNGIYSEMIG